MEEQTKPVRRRTKKAAESPTPAQHKEQKSGGLAVVIVILIAIMVVVAIVFAAQNKKTRGLENEVSSLKNKFEGKIAEVTDALDKQRQDQAKIEGELNEKAKLSKTYKSSVAGFTIHYPVSFVPEKRDVKLDATFKESFTVVREADKTKDYGEEGGPTVMVFDVYEVPADKDLVMWIIENGGAPYSTNYTEALVQKNEDGTLKSETKQIGDFQYFTYQWSGLLTGDEYFMRKDNYIIRISAVYMDQADPVQQEITSVIKTLRF